MFWRGCGVFSQLCDRRTGIFVEQCVKAYALTTGTASYLCEALRWRNRSAPYILGVTHKTELSISMTQTPPTLHMICGKIAAGKSTLAQKLATEPGSVLISEDDWLGILFGPDMATIADYVTYSARLRDVLGTHIVNLLRAGITVVLDAPANTVENRAWMRDILDQADATHQLHVLLPPDEVCLARLKARTSPW